MLPTNRQTDRQTNQCYEKHNLLGDNTITGSSSLYPFGMWTKVQFLGCDGELSF